MRILIAEDENEIAKALKVILERNKYAVDTVDNGADALDFILSGNCDAVVLDIMMPKKDGLQVVREARAQGCALPVLLLTAKGEIEDRVAGLDAGADDYLTKPFAMSEFLARVRALTRRAVAYAPDMLAFGNVKLDRAAYTLCTDSGEEKLNNKEFQLMELFLRSPRTVLSAEHLMERVWGYDSESQIDVVWAYIAFLRKKLKALGADIEIRTVRGAGYALEAL